MDFQARRHYRSQLGFDGDTVDQARERSEAVIESLGKPVRSTAASIFGSTRKIISKESEATFETVDNVLKQSVKEAHPRLRDLLQQNLENPGQLSSLDLTARINPVPQSIYLYFIRFRRGRSELVQVQRRVTQNILSYQSVLKLLQRGPGLRERGLINTFTSKIKINRAYKKENRIILDLDESIGAMGKHVIRDRLDQLVFTLTQFPGIDAVELQIQGQAIQTLGASSVSIRVPLKRNLRKINDLQ